jgi:hypothetical protein
MAGDNLVRNIELSLEISRIIVKESPPKTSGLQSKSKNDFDQRCKVTTHTDIE